MKTSRNLTHMLVALAGLVALCAVTFAQGGAAAVQVGTWNFRDPFIYKTLCRDLNEFMDKWGYKTISDLVGIAHR